MRRQLFVDEPVPGLRGLAALGDPDDGVAAVIDVPVIGARGDGKTQFIVHAIRTLRAHAPALVGDEQALNRAVMRTVLDPRAPRPDATPPGVVPHYVFRVRPTAQLARIGWLGAARLLSRGGGATGALIVSTMVAIAIGTVVAAATRSPSLGLAIGAVAVGVAAIVAGVVARRRLAAAGDLEVVFWDVAGEHVYSATAADYYALLANLVDARRRRADELGRGYALAPVLICNPVALGTTVEGSPYHRLRELLPLFAALDRDAARALIAINRWSVVDPICARGADRDEAIAVYATGAGEPAEAAAHPARVVRDVVREHCLDSEDGRRGEVTLRYLRYDTGIATEIAVDADGAIRYRFDDGPGAFTGDAERAFLGWLFDLVTWPRPDGAPAPRGEPDGESAVDPGHTLPGLGSLPPLSRRSATAADLGTEAPASPSRAAPSRIRDVAPLGSIPPEVGLRGELPPLASLAAPALEPSAELPRPDVWARPSLQRSALVPEGGGDGGGST
jgi:hypothetical protein